MYRHNARPDGPAPPPTIEPGVGVGAAILGRSRPDDVLDAFGHDGRISRYDPSGEVFSIDYDYDASGEYRASRAENAGRPSDFNVEFGLLKSIEIGPYQKALATASGIRYGAPIAHVIRELGPPTETLRDEKTSRHRWLDRGISVTYYENEGTVSFITLFRPRV